MTENQTTAGRYEVVEGTEHGNRFLVVNSDGDAELGNWLVCSTWWRAYADHIARLLNREEREAKTE